MKNCTKHFLERWTERIVGITTEKEKKEYITKNRDMIVEHANKTFEHADYIWKGQIGSNTTMNYYIEDDIIFVTNTSDDALITVYKIDLGFTPELNVTVRKGLVDEVRKLTVQKEEAEFQVMQEVEVKQHEIDQMGDTIKIFEEQLSNMKKHKSFMEEEVKIIKTKSHNVGLELKRYTMMLVNSQDYKNDLRSI